MKLVLIIGTLDAGGAERVMSVMANYWAARDWEIVLATLDDGAKPPFYPLDGRVRRICLAVMKDSANVISALANNGRRLWKVRRAIRDENPDAVISFLDTTNVLVIAATLGLGIPIIVSEHNTPERYRIKPVWNALRRWLYPRATQVVVLTERVRAAFPAALARRMAVIPNPVSFAAGVDEGEGPALPPRPRLVAMGRLTEQKGFDLLLEAFAGLEDRFPDWNLLILGEGGDRQSLEDQRDRLGLRSRVTMPGTVKNPQAILKQADLFVLPSRFEGFPMALCEAMSVGLPVVAADCPTGPREIIRDGVDGILFKPEDADALAQALARLMADAVERARLAERAPEVAERFGLDRVMGMWEALLSRVTGGRARP